MNIAEALKQAKEKNMCSRNKRLDIVLFIANDEIITILSCGIGTGLKMSVHTMLAEDWEVTNLTEKEKDRLKQKFGN